MGRETTHRTRHPHLAPGHPAPASGDHGASGTAGGSPARIRMYRVGFGDFFTLSVPKPSGEYAHILIDCGVHAKDLGVIAGAVDKLKEDTGGKLALVIMTHRHADHISGFAKAKETFQTFAVEQVWMSGFEDPHDKTASRIQAQITATAQKLQAALQAAPADNQHARMAGNALGVAGSNDVALAMLHGFKTADGKPTPVAYYWADDPPVLPPSLVERGLKAEILGPPKDPTLLAQMDNKPHQYLANGDSSDEDAAPRPFADAYASATFPWPAGKARLLTEDQIVQNIADAQAGIVAAATQNLDNCLNNQSLVVLFTFNGKTMLFAGDAQWGNWANFLFGGPLGTPGHTGLTDRSKAILGNLDFYKVGHHGSTNATPKDVVAAIGEKCVAMCSTAIGAYGKPKSNSEVPRVPLMDALGDKIGHRLARSDQVRVGTIDADPDAGTLPAPFTAGPGDSGYVDYLI
jgi:beta-lactamase superfamily II metal-dependent hydrolase